MEAQQPTTIPAPQARARPRRRPAGRRSRVDAQEQKARDTDARKILQDELDKAQAQLDALKKEYNNGQPERQGDEKNYQKYLDRTADLKAADRAHRVRHHRDHRANSRRRSDGRRAAPPPAARGRADAPRRRRRRRRACASAASTTPPSTTSPRWWPSSSPTASCVFANSVLEAVRRRRAPQAHARQHLRLVPRDGRAVARRSPRSRATSSRRAASTARSSASSVSCARARCRCT